MRPDPRVVCAALRATSGLVICGARHFDPLMRAVIAQLPGGWPAFCDAKYEDGFVDQYQNFLTRKEAHAIACKNGQIIRRCGGDEEELFSENLY